MTKTMAPRIPVYIGVESVGFVYLMPSGSWRAYSFPQSMGWGPIASQERAEQEVREAFYSAKVRK